MNRRLSFRCLAVMLLVSAVCGLSFGFVFGCLPWLIQTIAARF